MYDAVFYVQYPYYYPHFLPVSREYERRGLSVLYILTEKQNTELIVKIAEDEGLDYRLGDKYMKTVEARHFFFSTIFKQLDDVKGKKVYIEHGIGTKGFAYEAAVKRHDHLIVEGDYRFNSIRKRFPEFKDRIIKTGFSKLDPVHNASDDLKKSYFKHYQLDPEKPTILYAPTFFPSSIEKMSDKFPEDFSDCNIIVKAHYISLHRFRYRKQQKKMKTWSKYPNCHVCTIEEYDLVPFLTIADYMISDECSAIFEFTALDKPVILNKFLKLRWSYHLKPAKLEKRMDRGMDPFRAIGDNANSYPEMLSLLRENMANPSKYHKVRKQFMRELCGEVDGNASQRIVDFLTQSEQ